MNHKADAPLDEIALPYYTLRDQVKGQFKPWSSRQWRRGVAVVLTAVLSLLTIIFLAFFAITSIYPTWFTLTGASAIPYMLTLILMGWLSLLVYLSLYTLRKLDDEQKMVFSCIKWINTQAYSLSTLREICELASLGVGSSQNRGLFPTLFVTTIAVALFSERGIPFDTTVLLLSFLSTIWLKVLMLAQDVEENAIIEKATTILIRRYEAEQAHTRPAPDIWLPASFIQHHRANGSRHAAAPIPGIAFHSYKETVHD